MSEYRLLKLLVDETVKLFLRWATWTTSWWWR